MNKKINRYAKKLKAINHLGGFCSKCGEDNFFKLTFHHKENKEYKLSEIKEYRWSIIEKEINKCDLLCHNCHREHHHIENEDSWNRKAKLNLLDLYGVNYCEECGYDKCLSSLSFHHIRNKKITIGSLTYKLKDGFSSDDMVIKSIVNEFDNCSLLCVNCHLSKHGDVNFFNDNIELIKNKSNLIKEVRSKIDRNDILIKYNSGLSQSDIAKELGCSRGTICDIFKELKIK